MFKGVLRRAGEVLVRFGMKRPSIGMLEPSGYIIGENETAILNREKLSRRIGYAAIRRQTHDFAGFQIPAKYLNRRGRDNPTQAAELGHGSASRGQPTAALGDVLFKRLNL